MRPSTPKQYFAETHRAIAGSSIEWEELPSLAGSLAKRLISRGDSGVRSNVGERPGAIDSAFAPSTQFGSSWHDTAPTSLDTAPVSMPFREALEGLATREVVEPDVFQHFFGPASDA